MPTIHWAGSEESYEIVALAQAKVAEMKADWLSEQLAAMPPILSVQDGVGVVNASGSLVSGYAGPMRLFGALGYADINDALVEAMVNPDVKSILLNVDSGGGSVNGIGELSKTIGKFNAVKPIAMHAERVAASAGYWLGINASPITLGETAVMGSIGTLTVHTETSKALADMGVTKTIVRSGDFKAISNGIEPLSDLARAEIQSQIDDLTQLFEAAVAPARNFDAKQMAAAGQGREFLGKRAVAVGLADKVLNYEKAFSNVKKLDAAKTVPDNRNKSKGTNAMKHLTEAQLAQIQAGVPVSAILATSNLSAEQQAEVQAEATAQAEASRVAAEAETARVAAEAATAAATEAARIAAEAANNQPDPVVAHLTVQLAEANAAVTAAKIEAAQYKATAETAEPLLKIARTAIGKMSVALGGSAASAENLDAKAAVAEFDRITETFNTKFKVGGVAGSAAETKPVQSAVNPEFAAACKLAPQR